MARPTKKHRRNASAASRFAKSVFINCPFDSDYWPLLEALVFCLVDCGFEPRCALESHDSGEVRVRKISRLIKASRYSIHDISRIEVSENGLPRFNMPFELGLDMGCRRFGSAALHSKRCLILDAKQHRYQASLSDIAGQDIRIHDNLAERLIDETRGWLRSASRRSTVPGQVQVRARYAAFSENLSDVCKAAGLDRQKLEFADYLQLVQNWLDEQRHAKGA